MEKIFNAQMALHSDRKNALVNIIVVVSELVHQIMIEELPESAGEGVEMDLLTLIDRVMGAHELIDPSKLEVYFKPQSSELKRVLFDSTPSPFGRIFGGISSFEPVSQQGDSMPKRWFPA